MFICKGALFPYTRKENDSGYSSLTNLTTLIYHTFPSHLPTIEPYHPKPKLSSPHFDKTVYLLLRAFTPFL